MELEVLICSLTSFFLSFSLYLWCRSTAVLWGHWDDDWVPAKQVLENLLGLCHTNHSHSMSTLYLIDHSWLLWHTSSATACTHSSVLLLLVSTATNSLSLSLSSLFWHSVCTSGRWWHMRITLIQPGLWFSAGLWSSVLSYGFPLCLLLRCTLHLDRLLR